MAHPEETSEAVSAPFDSIDDAAAAFAKYRDEGNEEIQQDDEPAEDESETEEVSEPEEVEEPDAVEDDSDVEEEPEAAIDPPVSWDAEAKERFTKLPPEDQAYIVEREGQREKFLTTKAEEAANARKIAEKASADLDVSTRQFAAQLETIAKAILPHKPDYSLLANDPQTYAAHMAHYDAAHAQYQELMQQSEQARAHADKAAEDAQSQAIREDAQRVMSDLPEMADAQQWQQLLNDLTPVAKALGYTEERIAQAWPTDVLAMKRVAGLKDKADKWDALQAKKMETVRAAKKVSTPGVAQPKGSVRARQTQESMSRLRQTGDLRDAAKAFRAITGT